MLRSQGIFQTVYIAIKLMASHSLRFQESLPTRVVFWVAQILFQVAFKNMIYFKNQYLFYVYKCIYILYTYSHIVDIHISKKYMYVKYNPAIIPEKQLCRNGRIQLKVLLGDGVVLGILHTRDSLQCIKSLGAMNQNIYYSTTATFFTSDMGWIAHHRQLYC